MMGRTTPWQGLFAYGDLFALYLNQISGHNPPVKPDSSGKQWGRASNLFSVVSFTW